MSVNGVKREYEFSQPVSMTWDEARVITPGGWERMKKGVQPRDMDDRWIIAHQDDGEEEAVVFVRSWTRYLVYKITVVPAGEDGRCRRVARISWEADDARWRSLDKEKAAKNDVARFARGRFQVDLADELEGEE